MTFKERIDINSVAVVNDDDSPIVYTEPIDVPTPPLIQFITPPVMKKIPVGILDDIDEVNVNVVPLIKAEKPIEAGTFAVICC